MADDVVSLLKGLGVVAVQALKDRRAGGRVALSETTLLFWISAMTVVTIADLGGRDPFGLVAAIRAVLCLAVAIIPSVRSERTALMAFLVSIVISVVLFRHGAHADAFTLVLSVWGAIHVVAFNFVRVR